jgi:hypothetical protein
VSLLYGVLMTNVIFVKFIVMEVFKSDSMDIYKNFLYFLAPNKGDRNVGREFSLPCIIYCYTGVADRRDYDSWQKLHRNENYLILAQIVAESSFLGMCMEHEMKVSELAFAFR